MAVLHDGISVLAAVGVGSGADVGGGVVEIP
jgi:hypothetical protein